MTKEQEQEFNEFQERVNARDADMAKSRAMRPLADTHYPGPNPKPMPSRKVVQIATVGQSKRQRATLTALCEDGSMWMLGEELDWAKVPDIPQD